jgi:type I restriction enzyme, S subunit
MTTEQVFSSYMSPLGLLPSGWRLGRIKDFALKVGSGATPTGGSEVYLPQRTNYALIRSQNVFDRHFDDTGLVFISDEHARQLQGVFVQPKDVLLNITGDGITFGRACLAPERVLPACVNQHVSIIRAKPEVCDAGYLLSYLTHPLTKVYIESFNAGGSRRAITKGHIEAFVVPLPPLAEQRAIARILGALDDKIELNRQMNATLEALACALFQSWFVDFDPVRAKAAGFAPHGMDAAAAALFPNGFEESVLGEVPRGWKVLPLGDFLNLKRGYDLPEASRVPGTTPIISSSGRSGWHSSPKVKGPGVVTGRYGTIGQVFFIGEDFWPLNTTLYVQDFKGNEPRVAYHLLTNIDFGAYSDKAAVPGVNRNHVHQEQIIAPPPETQRAFSHRVDSLWQKHATNLRESATLATIRDALLPRLLSGAIRVGEAEQIVEEAV